MKLYAQRQLALLQWIQSAVHRGELTRTTIRHNPRERTCHTRFFFCVNNLSTNPRMSLLWPWAIGYPINHHAASRMISSCPIPYSHGGAMAQATFKVCNVASADINVRTSDKVCTAATLPALGSKPRMS